MVKNQSAMQETWVAKIPWRSERLPTPVFLHEEFHGHRSLIYIYIYIYIYIGHAIWYGMQNLNSLTRKPMGPAVEAQSLNYWMAKEVPIFCTYEIIIMKSQ